MGADRLGLALPTGRRPRAAEAASGTELMTADAGDAEPLLQTLEQTGWNVSLAARRSRHCPGTQSATASRSSASAPARPGPRRPRPRPIRQRPHCRR